MILTHEEAERAAAAVTAAVEAFSATMDVDKNAGRNALFGALLAEFVGANGAASRAELDTLVGYIEDRVQYANELNKGAEQVEVPE